MTPINRIVKKHLLPVCNRSMIADSIQTLHDSGMYDMMIAIGRGNAEKLLRPHGNGGEFGLRRRTVRPVLAQYTEL